MDIASAIATWVHTLALVIVMGYYGVLGRLVITSLQRSLDSISQAKALSALERRALPLVVLSVVLFIVTGTYLLFVSDRYEGLGNLFASTWTTLILLKHLVVVAFIALGVVVDIFVRDLPELTTDVDRGAALRRVRLTAELATGTGALVILLTALAQAAT